MAENGKFKVNTTIDGTVDAPDQASVLKQDAGGGCGCGNCAGSNGGKQAGSRAAG